MNITEKIDKKLNEDRVRLTRDEFMKICNDNGLKDSRITDSFYISVKDLVGIGVDRMIKVLEEVRRKTY